MLDKKEKLESPSEEQLVAYLDCELDEESAHRIEKQLADDPELRQKLNSLSGAWAMLDELQPPEMNKDFTESTLEIVALSTENGDGNVASRIGKLRQISFFTSFFVVAAWLGYVFVDVVRPDTNQQLLEDLPVIERLDELREIDKIEFLRELHRSELFSEDSTND